MATASFTLPTAATSYATADLCVFYAGSEDELRQLVNGNHDASKAIDVGRLQIACDAAQALVDQYVGKQKAVPLALADVPPSLAHLTARIAIYQLRSSRRQVDVESHGMLYENDIKTLEAIRDGMISLGTGIELPKAVSRLDGQYQIAPWKERSYAKLRGFS